MLSKAFHLKNKLLIFTVLFSILCAFTSGKPDFYINKNHRTTNDTIPEIVVSGTKTGLYTIYLNYCNELVIDTILQSGYLNFDTMRVASIPVNSLYFGKTIIKSLQLSKDLANIIVMDTIWNLLEVPEYQSTYDYYILAKHPMPAKKSDDFDYSNKIIVFRPKVFTLKRSKPLPYNDWDKYINNKPNRRTTTEQYF